MKFVYTALNAEGNRLQERLNANTEDEAVRNLHRRGYVVLALEPEQAETEERPASRVWRELSLLGQRVRPEQVVALTREFAIMTETGVPLVEALDLLIEHCDSQPIRTALVATHAAVSEGQTMSQAMGLHPHVFPKLYVDMVRTAELGGTLTETLNQAADYQEYALEMRRKVQGALTYPAVLIGFATSVVFFMLIYLIPQFYAIYTQMHVAVPASTLLLFQIGVGLRTYWQLLLALLLPGIPLLRRLSGLPRVQQAMTGLARRLPVIGDTLTKVAMARLLRALGTLLGTGVGLLPALDASAQTTQDRYYELAFQQIRVQVEQGRTLAAAMSDSGAVPALICQMVAVGEKSGRLSPVLQRIARYYESEVDARLKSITSILEPLMVAAIGVAVGFIAIAVIGPIYSVLDGIK